jgi:hypothetical protein
MKGSLVRLAVVSLTMSMPATNVAAEDGGTLLVVVNRGPSGPVYKIDSKVTAAKDLLATLNNIVLSRGHKLHVLVLVHEDTSLRTVDDLRGFLSKAGFADLKLYYFKPDKRYMLELSFAKQVVPYSESVDVGGRP